MQVYSLESMQKNMAFKEHNSGTSMSQMELLRTKGRRFCRILQSSVITKIEARRPDIVVIDKAMKEVKIVDATKPGDVWVNK